VIKTNYDIIIIGAGVSGLILANEIIERTNKNILIIEKEKNKLVNKNLCFWNQPSNILTTFAESSWENISIYIDGKRISLASQGIKYLRIKSSNLRKFFINKLRKKRNFTILNNQNIESVINDKKNIYIKVKENTYSSKLLFDSRIEEDDTEKKGLLQHFYGIEVMFKKNILNKGEVVLMDIQNKGNLFNFFYILPFSKNRALIETTYFSQKNLSLNEYKTDIKRYINKHFNGYDYKIKSYETGIIPMFKYKRFNSHNHIKIGLAGNWVKQSTGYSLQNCFLYSKQLVDCVIKGQKPQIKEKRILNFLDKTFCIFIKNNPNKSKFFFENFFKRNNLEILVKFMTNSANIFQIFRIIITLPKFHIIKSLLIDK
jgi:lycopene beta-cyclase